jgi:hypothetical protein
MLSGPAPVTTLMLAEYALKADVEATKADTARLGLVLDNLEARIRQASLLGHGKIWGRLWGQMPVCTEVNVCLHALPCQ